MKLKKKLVLNYLAATVLALVFVGFAVIRGLEKLSITTMEQQLIDQSKLAEIYISQIHSLEGQEDPENLNLETANMVISKLGLIIGNVNIYDKSLKLQAASKGKEQLTIEEGLNEKVLKAALETENYAYIIRENKVYFASPITYEGSTIGILEIISPMSLIEKLITGVSKIVLIGAGAFTIIMTLLIVYIAGKMTKPINKLARAATKFAGRDFTPVEIKGSDEISQLSESFNNMGVQLQDYIQRQKQFVSNVSHELKTPLTAIKGYSEYLKDEVGDRQDLQKAIYHLNNEATRLGKLVDEVLTLSRMDNSSESFNFQEIDLSELVKESVEKMQLRAEKYHIKTRSEIQENIYIKGDKEKLLQVFINLLDNAIKFSPPQSIVEVTLKKEDNKALLRIRDYGIGIPKEAASKIFERFYRAENAEGIVGTGLGLSIAKHIIDGHKGDIELNPLIEGGTEAIIKLP
ncbi:MAG: HAMP domain-containing histidine kinase [Clostridia bacterium]|nr:HAMP domain-containing histidine kinase [Clostridia bacterium]